MPGHSEEVLAVYPELSCAGKPYVYDDLCVGKEKTFEFLENVLTEVMELFPSEYIHIGGDEATKKGWTTCPKCRTRMQREGLKDLDELQSYAVHRVEEFLNARGRKLLGWDEILQGGLAPNAAVMSWRGMSGGRKGGCLGPSVVMTPGSFCYLDKYQGNPSTEPKALEGSLPLAKGLHVRARTRRHGGPRERAGRAGQPVDRVCSDGRACRIHLPAHVRPLPRWRGPHPNGRITTISTAVHCCASRRRARRGTIPLIRSLRSVRSVLRPSSR